jgi:hypothetical protein
MAPVDSRGLPLSTRSEQAAALYREGVDMLLSAWPTAPSVVDAAISADPDFALAHAARARLHAIRGEAADARACIAKAADLVAKNGTERERSHVAVLSSLVHGRAAEALSGTLAHVESWPRDVLILSLPLGAFGLFAFSGMADHDQARVDLCERHARHFGDDDWWFTTYRGWSHAENGNVAHGRGLTQRGYELRTQNANAAHALSHCLYEAGEAVTAEKLIEGWLPGYDRTGTLHAHIAWHAALGALDRDDPEGALAIYARHIQPSVTAGLPVNVVSDTASFLWRLKAYGYPVPAGLWNDAAGYARNHFQKAGFAFADVHMALVSAAMGDAASVEERVRELTKLVDAGALPAGAVVPAFCRAALAFANEDYAACARHLEPVAGDVVRIGGSGAQRELKEDMLLLAHLRGGEPRKARALLDRRLHRRPSVRDSRWLAALAA